MTVLNYLPVIIAELISSCTSAAFVIPRFTDSEFSHSSIVGVIFTVTCLVLISLNMDAPYLVIFLCKKPPLQGHSKLQGYTICFDIIIVPLIRFSSQK